MLFSSNGTANNLTHDLLTRHAAHYYTSARDEASIPFLPTWQNLLGMVLSVVVSIITGPGGMGGSGFYIPMFNVLLRFSVAESAAITSFVVFLGCISSTVHAMTTPHPTNPDKARIDYITVVVLLPALLLGVSYGVMANAILPAWLLNLLLMVIWTWTCWKLLIAFKGAYHKENESRASGGGTSNLGKSPTKSVAGPSSSSSSRMDDLAVTDDHSTTAVHSISNKQTLECKGDADHISVLRRWQTNMSQRIQNFKVWSTKQPWAAIWTIFGLFVGFVGFTVIREVATATCHSAYWALLAVQGGLLLAAALVISVVLIRQRRPGGAGSCSTTVKGSAAASDKSGTCSQIEVITSTSAQVPAQHLQEQSITLLTRDVSIHHLSMPVSVAPAGGVARAPGTHNSLVSKLRNKLAARAAARAEARALAFVVNEEAIVWSVNKLVITPFLMLVIGIIASMLGVGGAALVSPLILSWGLHPQVGAATSRMILMLSTGSSSLSFLAAGRMNVVYALVYGGINVVFTPLGIYFMDWFVRKTGHPSYVTMLSLVRTVAGVVVQTAFSLVPSLIFLRYGQPPMLGFNPQGLCH